jgi:hypothetical protein
MTKPNCQISSHHCVPTYTHVVFFGVALVYNCFLTVICLNVSRKQVIEMAFDLPRSIHNAKRLLGRRQIVLQACGLQPDVMRDHDELPGVHAVR